MKKIKNTTNIRTAWGGVLLNKKGIIPVFVVILTILTILISIGYSALNQNLSVSGEAFLRSKGNVRISRIEMSNAENDGYETNNPEYSKKGTKTYSTLSNKNSTITYTVQITNTTGAKYTVYSMEISNTNSNVSCTPNITKGSIIEEGISDFTIDVKYNGTDSLTESIEDVCDIRYDFIPLDTTSPVLTVEIISQENKTAKLKITATDEDGGSGLSPDNIYKYCLSTSGEEAKECTWTNYISGEEFEVTASSNGEYYLLVYSIGDKAGNISDEKENIGEIVNKLYVPLFNKVQDFTYTGSEQTYTVPADGYYKIEAWGAQGWPEVTDLNTGLGGYTSGYIYLTKGENLYVYVGQGNGNGQNIAAFNNGTPNYGGYSGGGATDIRLVGGTWTDATSINSRIMVAGGGGAGGYGKGGAGGGLFGNNASGTKGGTQTSSGASQTTNYPDSSFGIANGGCTGGNGYYPGGGATCADGAGGGSSFISGYAGVNAITSASDRTHTNNTIHYSGKYFINSIMELGTNTGNGKVSITYLSKTEPERKNTRLNNVRYIKDCTNGSTSNDSNHWVELQAIYQGVNVAKGKSVTSNNSVNSTPGTGTVTSIVDGILTSSLYSDFPNSKQCITVDLGNNYDLDEIAIWHYWQDNRTYFENETSVSSDNTNWVTVTMPTTEEKGNGRRINAYESYVQPLKLSLNLDGGKYASQENTVVYYVNSGKSIDLLTPTKVGYAFSGWTVSGTDSSLKDSTFVMGSTDTTLTANWRLTTYTLTVNPNGGVLNGTTNNSTYNIASGSTETILNPTRTGYVFAGWTVSGQGSSMSGTTFTMGYENATLTANWASSKPTYTYTGSSQLIDDGNGNWRIKFLTSGTLTFTNLGTGVNGIDVFLVGGGGGGRTGSQSVNGAGGGGGGYTTTKKGHTISAGSSYNIVIGAGGATNSNGGTSSAFGFSAAGGKYGSPGSSNFGVEVAIGGNGGSGGGGGTSYQGYGGNGGSNGSNGSNGTGGNGGKGQGTTTREFGESDGTLYAGGGAGTEGKAGAGGGGVYNNTNNSDRYYVANGTANTGGGGGGGAFNFIKGGTGGSGIVVIRNTRVVPTEQMPSYTYTGTSRLEVDKNGNWKIKFLSSGTLTFTSLGDGTTAVDLFLVGGGGSGRYAGGGGGYTRTVKSLNIALNTSQQIVVGKGAAFSFTETINGGSSSALGYTAAGGYGVGQADKGGNGGSGGGGYAYSDSNSWAGSGGTNGKNGDASSSGCSGGYGQISVPGPNGETGNTREFGESTGDLYSGGGGGTAASGSAGLPGEVTTATNSGRGGGGVAGEDGIVIIRKHQ